MYPCRPRGTETKETDMSRVDRYYSDNSNNSSDDFWREPAKTPKKDSKAYKKARKKDKRKHGFFRKLIITLLIIGLACGIAGGVYAAICIAGAPQINPENIYETLDLSTNIYDDEGKLYDSVYYDENRKITEYEEMPENLINAFIAIEDKTFWKHHGFNFKRMVGAVLGSFRSGSISGTSTITQQLARNVFLADVKSQRSIKRKIIEMYYAYEIEQALDKEDIIEAYLNTIYLGYGCYGVSSASRTYFSVNVDELSLEQCAALAALPQAPDSYALLKTEEGEACTELKDGYYANDISQDRRYLVLSLMANQGLITEDDAAKAKVPLTEFIDPSVISSSTSQSYFKDYLIEEVVADLMDEYGKTEQEARNMVYTKGLKIYSTLDSTAQKVVTKEFKKDSNFPKDVKGNLPEAAMVITEIGTGEIKAMAGGRDPKGQMLFNRATNARQPGSSIKPLAVYGAALQKSYELQKEGKTYNYTQYADEATWGQYITTSSAVSDTKMVVDGKAWPKNANNKFTGANTFRTAIQQSINTCAVKILMQVGVDYSADLVKSFGITTLVDDTSQAVNDMNLASLALGGMSQGVTPLEMSLAYGAFVNEGKVNTAICYTKVEDKNGKVLLESKSETTQVIDPGVAWIMCDVLQSVVTDGIAGGAKISKVQSGGKTGTTNDQYDIWFDGFTPSYSASLWIGTDNNVALTTMSGPAAALWGKIMNQIPKAKEGKYNSAPSNVTKVNGEYYTKGTEPSKTSTVELNDDGSVKTESNNGERGHGTDEGTEKTLDEILKKGKKSN